MIKMLPAIKLNNDSGFITHKVDYVGLYDRLSAEFVTFQPPPAYLPPQYLFGIGSICT